MEQITLEKYRNLAGTLSYKQPFSACCGVPLFEIVHVEPLSGRSTLEVKRTCILECDQCHKKYVSAYD